MRFNDDNRRPKPGRGSGAGHDGKSFDKKRSSNTFRGGNGRSFDKPKFGDYKGKPSEPRGEGKGYKDNRSEGGESRSYRSFDKPSFDKPRFNDYKDGGRSDSRGGSRENSYGGKSDFKPRFGKKSERGDYKPRSTNYSDSNEDGFKPRLVKRTGASETEKRPFERYAKSENMKMYTETRFTEGRKMRPRAKNAGDEDYFDPNAKYSKKKQIEYSKSNVDLSKPMRLNKFIANAGLCSRREADEYIKAGVITVNGEVVSELGAKVIPATDRVLFHDQLVRSEKKVYLLLNKPKDCVTTTEDTNARLTVMDLVKNACNERIYPVGRLDRNTTGVLLLTNDGDLAAKLMHPKYNKKKIYHVHLDKALTKADMQQIVDGIELEDGPIQADDVHFVEEDDKKQVGIEIHSGRNRLVRRIFEHLGYKVVRLDRVFFAGLTKKNLSRGQWRFLSEKEVNMLRMGAYE
jgi:23S rRNA pseudouridine2605 synthase